MTVPIRDFRASGLSFSRIPLSLQDGFFQGRMTAP